MRWSPAVLFGCAVLACGAIAWSQVDPGPRAAQGQQASQDDDCLEQEDAAAVRQGRRTDLAGRIDLATAPRFPLAPEMVDRVMEVATDIDAAMANRLRRLQQRDPAGFDRAMRTIGRRLLGMAELKVRDPKLYSFKLQELRIDEQVQKAAARLREAKRTASSDVEQREEDLRTYVRIQVALSIKSRVEYLARLREHITALEEAINRDALNFEHSVEERMGALLAAEPVEPAPDE
ncbi:MAG: hypothetical protein ACYTJ0_15870 [Planctomycetota bacterium]|jgi:hypothetical protein